jgi:hypothetical protein
MAMNKLGSHKASTTPIKKSTKIKPMASSKKVTPKSAPKMGPKGSC